MKTDRIRSPIEDNIVLARHYGEFWEQVCDGKIGKRCEPKTQIVNTKSRRVTCANQDHVGPSFRDAEIFQLGRDSLGVRHQSPINSVEFDQGLEVTRRTKAN